MRHPRASCVELKPPGGAARDWMDRYGSSRLGKSQDWKAKATCFACGKRWSEARKQKIGPRQRSRGPIHRTASRRETRPMVRARDTKHRSRKLLLPARVRLGRTD